MKKIFFILITILIPCTAISMKLNDFLNNCHQDLTEKFVPSMLSDASSIVNNMHKKILERAPQDKHNFSISFDLSTNDILDCGNGKIHWQIASWLRGLTQKFKGTNLSGNRNRKFSVPTATASINDRYDQTSNNSNDIDYENTISTNNAAVCDAIPDYVQQPTIATTTFLNGYTAYLTEFLKPSTVCHNTTRLRMVLQRLERDDFILNTQACETLRSALLEPNNSPMSDDRLKANALAHCKGFLETTYKKGVHITQIPRETNKKNFKPITIESIDNTINIDNNAICNTMPDVEFISSVSLATFLKNYAEFLECGHHTKNNMPLRARTVDDNKKRLGIVLKALQERDDIFLLNAKKCESLKEKFSKYSNNDPQSTSKHTNRMKANAMNHCLRFVKEVYGGNVCIRQ